MDKIVYKNPSHTLRRHMVNPYGRHNIKYTEIHGELGSGLYTEDETEIYENDRLIAYQAGIQYTGHVAFQDGSFVFVYDEAGHCDLLVNFTQYSITGHKLDA